MVNSEPPLSQRSTANGTSPLEYWDRAKNSQDASEYEAYLKQYPIEAFAD